MSGRHYLDHASTAPLRPEARAATVAALDLVGDPGRLHEEAMTSRVALEAARAQVAETFGARPREVVFTGSGTEAIATAVAGAAGRGRRQVVSAVEHAAVRRAAERVGEVTVVAVDGRGRVDSQAVVDAVRPDTSVVHVQAGNHEVGTRQPVADVVAACAHLDVLIHVDAAQANGHDPIDFAALGADLVSLSAHKFGGPAGVGALLVRRGLRLDPLLVGGDQERARRAGLENVAGVAGFAAACAALGEGRLDDEAHRARHLTDRVLTAVAGMDGIPAYGDPVDRLPHIVCLGIEGVEPQAVLLGLDAVGVAVHSGSACSSEALEPSPVLEAMGVDAHRSLRVSVGWSTTEADIDAFLDALPRVVGDLRALGTG